MGIAAFLPTYFSLPLSDDIIANGIVERICYVICGLQRLVATFIFFKFEALARVLEYSAERALLGERGRFGQGQMCPLAIPRTDSDCHTLNRIILCETKALGNWLKEKCSHFFRYCFTDLGKIRG